MFWYILLFFVGAIVGGAIMALLSRSESMGDICIYKNDDGFDIPYLALKGPTTIDIIKRKKYISLRVVNIKDRSQK